MKYVLIFLLIPFVLKSQIMEVENLAYATIEKDNGIFKFGEISIDENSITIQKTGSYKLYFQSSESLIVRYNSDTICNREKSKYEGKSVWHSFSWQNENSQGESKPMKKGDIISWGEFEKVSINQIPQSYKAIGYGNTQYKKGYKYYRFQGTKKEYWELLEWVCVYDPDLDTNTPDELKSEKMYRWRALCDGVECWTDDYWIAKGTPIN